ESFTEPLQNEGFDEPSFTNKKEDEGKRQKQKVGERLDGIEYCERNGTRKRKEQYERNITSDNSDGPRRRSGPQGKKKAFEMKRLGQALRLLNKLFLVVTVH
ncbi:hypothetical protein NPIL_156431, partial [Nephila pilipes]